MSSSAISTLSAPFSSEELCRIYFQDKPSLKDSVSGCLTGSARFIINQSRQQLAQTDLGGRNPSEKELFELVRSVQEREQEYLSDQERTAVVAALSSSFEDFDVLTGLVDDPQINDIIVRSYDDISVQKGRSNFQTGLAFSDNESYKAFVEQLLKRAGKSCTVATPVVDAAVGSEIRLCVSHESLTPEGIGPLLTIRLARHTKTSLSALEQFGLAPRIVLDYLATLVESGQCTLLIAGEVGTGKTTLVRALASVIPEHEAILVIEDTQEIRLERKFVRTLLTREANSEGAGRVSTAQAIRTGMRMAMNRIILGEMRDGEAAESFIDASASGHPGMSTIHARSARDALARLELFLSRAQSNVSIDTVRRQISSAVSAVVFLGVDPFTRERRIMEVVEVDSASEGMVQISPIFQYLTDSSGATWLRASGVSKFNLAKYGFSFPSFGEKLLLDSIATYSSYTSKRGDI